ncbi:MAG: aminotransferase class I/II-fold pyridoxal phosphate-dependent enzyme [Myxococcales bacterium]|nr:aminotransferase class I/II-fold pyridoxal phosphate-dependent enzyme [Myxococcales bacterium]MCB9648596.1 aminotransferase class I/II-fold pyridoxal phosphate-dependent enzyme [Deltaproteobacteria bacterium]
MVSEKLRPFGTTVFSEMTRLALEHGAINLSQGFPDFEGPEAIREAAVEALRAGHNQYARSQGVLPLVQAVAAHQAGWYGLAVDPLTEVAVFSGATEGLMSAMLGLLNPGDEVILFEPVYDSYPACVAMAQAVPRYATLRFPDFAVDLEHLASLFTPRTRLLVLNSPHNPTGKVFTPDELAAIAELCIRHDVTVLSDEVYEHLTYDGARHVPIATLPGMRDRTLTLSSVGKTFSFTGWKVGWASGPAPLIRAAQAAHQFVTFATATPLQHAAAAALSTLGPDFYEGLVAEYTARRDLLLPVLAGMGLQPALPKGAYFILADFTSTFDGDDLAFARHLVEDVGVAAIPPSAFYPAHPEEGRRLVRFAFCKKMDTLRAAAARLRGH